MSNETKWTQDLVVHAEALLARMQEMADWEDEGTEVDSYGYTLGGEEVAGLRAALAKARGEK